MFKKITIVLSRSCNLRCDYCILKKYNYSKETVRWLAIKKFIDYSFKKWLEENEELKIYFFGGEPLLHFDLIKKTVEYCHKNYKNENKNIKFRVTTNGTVFTKEKIKFLKYNNFEIHVSLDGDQLSQNQHRSFSDRKGSFLSIMKYLPYLTNYPNFIVNMVISPDNVKRTSVNFDFFVKKRIRVIKLLVDLMYSPNKKWWNKYLIEEFKNQIHCLINKYFLLKKMGYPIHFLDLTQKDKYAVEQETCLTGLRRNLTLMPNGKVYICAVCVPDMVVDKQSNQFMLGNIFHKNFSSKFSQLERYCVNLENQKIFCGKTLKELAKNYIWICFLFSSDFFKYKIKKINNYLTIHRTLLEVWFKDCYSYYNKQAKRNGFW